MNFLLTNTPLLYLTQSFWRDEAFSVLLAEKPIPFIIEKLTLETPLYFILLHIWMKIFGNGEVAARSLSLVGFALATIIVVHWAEKLFDKHWLSWFLPIFFFVNPMLLYYAFEVRTYGWYIFFAVLSMYSYMEKRWHLYVAATVLGFYTHSYMLIVPFVQFIHYFLTNPHALNLKRFRTFVRDPMIRSTAAIAAFISPWLWKIVVDLPQLKHSWYFPVDFQLVWSALGNLFLGYEGTPGNLWSHTAFLSLILFGFFLFALKARKQHLTRNSFFFLQIILPLVVIIGISFVKPLYVNRYVLPVTIAEVFLLVFALSAVRNQAIQKILAATFLLFVLGFNMWYPSRHAKMDIRTTIREINALKQKNDVILAESPLVFFESIYYSTDRSRVYLYNPNNVAFPRYVGDAIVSPSQMAQDYPPYPIRAFIVRRKGSFDVAYQAPITFSEYKARIPTPKQP